MCRYVYIYLYLYIVIIGFSELVNKYWAFWWPAQSQLAPFYTELNVLFNIREDVVLYIKHQNLGRQCYIPVAILRVGDHFSAHASQCHTEFQLLPGWYQDPWQYLHLLGLPRCSAATQADTSRGPLGRAGSSQLAWCGNLW